MCGGGCFENVKDKGVSNSGGTEHPWTEKSSALWVCKHHPGTDRQLCVKAGVEQGHMQPPHP